MVSQKYAFSLQLDKPGGLPLRFFSATAADLRQLFEAIGDLRAIEGHEPEWEIDTHDLTISASINGVSAETLQDITNDAYDGFLAVESGDPDLPPTINQESRQIIRRVINRIRRIAPAVMVAPGREPHPIVEWPQIRVDKRRRVLVASAYVDGRLDVISVRSVPYFVLFEHGTDTRVRCNFPDDWIERVKDNLRSRVIVEGRVVYRDDGRPSFLSDPTDIRKVPPPKQADLTAYRGSIPDLTGDVSSYAYVRSLREEDQGVP